MERKSSQPLQDEIGDVSISDQFAALHERFRLVEQIDQQTTDMVARLSEAVASSAEARAFASLSIAHELQQLAETLEERQARQLTALGTIFSEVAATHTNAVGLLNIVRLLDNRLEQSLNRIETPPVMARPDATSESAPPAPIVLSNAEGTIRLSVDQVPNAVTALAIQRFLSTLPDVQTVTARSFSDAVLHFDLQVRNAYSGSDLAQVSEGGLVLQETSSREIRLRLALPERFLEGHLGDA
jgi:hypothetical protein